MNRHRLGLLLYSVISLALAAPVSAQQVFLERLWVHNRQTNCPVDVNDGQMNCVGATSAVPLTPSPDGNISNDPHIEFDNDVDTTNCGTAALLPGRHSNNVCNKDVALCTEVGFANEQAGNTPFALDFVSFELFKFSEGANPLDAQSTPPLRTFFVDNPGIVPGGTNSTASPGALLPVCVLWDGDINIKGEFGKSNGQYGFRATVATNQTGASGNINITQTRAYPGGFTQDVNNVTVDQKPITLDVVNVHVVRTSPTVVGTLTGVAAQPYNITYRLSKDATTFVSIHQANTGTSIVRNIVPGAARVGEGTPDGTLQNGDSWNGRYENGALAPSGVYLASIIAEANDQYGRDLSRAVTRQVSVDTLLITDLRTQPLTSQSTSLAVLSYVLTEPATVYVDIYPPGTQFLAGLNNINQMADTNPAAAAGSEPRVLADAGVQKAFQPRLNGNLVLPVRHIEEQKDFRKSVISFWDGRNSNGQVMPDGDYVFVVYAALPSANGFTYVDGSKRIWSSNARSGFLTVSRGLVTISQVGPSSTVVGSSPPVAGLDPFSFTYSLSREALVSLKIFDNSGTNLVKTIISDQVRPGNFLNRETWDTPTGDDGLYVSSGNYLVELTASDPFFPNKVSTTTALFPINLFRITDVQTTALLTGATDVVTIAYQLSQPMNVTWSIYQPGTVISGSSSTWPPCNTTSPAASCGQITNGGNPTAPLISIKGLRPGRLRITEFWDGRDRDGLFVPDGNYIYTLVAESTTTPKMFATDKVFGTLTVARGSIVFPIFNITPTFPSLFNSSQTISLPPYEVDYSLTRQSSVTIQVLTTSVGPKVVRTLISGQVRDSNILNREFWDARDDVGNFVQPGFYTVRAIADDLASVLSSGSTAQQTISVDPLRIYDVAISPLRNDFNTALLAYQVSETMKVAIKIYGPGTTFDSNGNPTPPETTSLIKRIVGVRPARTEISEVWDGTDETLSIVPDGNYIFKIVASTDINSIDSITGDAVAGAALAEDLVIAEIPVVRGGSQNAADDFVQNSFVYPNPIRGGTGTFRIYVPLQASVEIKIFNIAGEQVLEKNFGERPADTYVSFVWDKTNDAGRPVAHGMYFYIIRQKSTKGDNQLFQAVKKFLIP